MNYPYDILPEPWHWLAAILYILILILALANAPWHKLGNGKTLHLYLGTCVALMILWGIKANTIPGLEYHYLGATLLTLMFGWQLAYIAVNIILAAIIINGGGDWQSFPMNTLIMGIVPIIVSHIIYKLVEAKLPNHFFIYVFLNAFFGAALALTALIALSACVLMLGGVYTMEQLSSDYFPVIPLMAFPEAFITGALITSMVIMRPNWVSTFSDSRYLNGK